MRHLANAHSVTGPAGKYIQDAFFWRLVGPVAPTDKAIVQFLRYSPDKILKVQVIISRSKVKSRLYHDTVHLHLLSNVPTKCQL